MFINATNFSKINNIAIILAQKANTPSQKSTSKPLFKYHLIKTEKIIATTN